jgi:ribonucleotide reductase alpha subunit
VKWLKEGKEELYDNLADPYQMRNLAEGKTDAGMLEKMRTRLKELLAAAHDEFLPGTAYADWYNDRRELVRTALGPRVRISGGRGVRTAELHKGNAPGELVRRR